MPSSYTVLCSDDFGKQTVESVLTTATSKSRLTSKLQRTGKIRASASVHSTVGFTKKKEKKQGSSCSFEIKFDVDIGPALKSTPHKTPQFTQTRKLKISGVILVFEKT